jgi:hypothetical protein
VSWPPSAKVFLISVGVHSRGVALYCNSTLSAQLVLGLPRACPAVMGVFSDESDGPSVASAPHELQSGGGLYLHKLAKRRRGVGSYRSHQIDSCDPIRQSGRFRSLGDEKNNYNGSKWVMRIKGDRDQPRGKVASTKTMVMTICLQLWACHPTEMTQCQISMLHLPRILGQRCKLRCSAVQSVVQSVSRG